ncbi:MAG: hypothetical protein M3O22_07705 [Pseudomonadota bacterium]|nr:hypothetical protein [Pseudomonadota bacterium]
MKDWIRAWSGRIAAGTGLWLVFQTCGMKDEAEISLQKAERRLTHATGAHKEVFSGQTLHGWHFEEYHWDNAAMAADIALLSGRVTASGHEAAALGQENADLQRLADYFLIRSLAQDLAGASEEQARAVEKSLEKTLAGMASRDTGRDDHPRFVFLTVQGMGLSRAQFDTLWDGNPDSQTLAQARQGIVVRLKAWGMSGADGTVDALTQAFADSTRAGGENARNFFVHPAGHDGLHVVYISASPEMLGARDVFVYRTLSAYGEVLADQMWPGQELLSHNPDLTGECLVADMRERLQTAGFPWTTWIGMKNARCVFPDAQTGLSGKYARSFCGLGAAP